MTREHAEKWLDYLNRGIKPTRFKLESLVFSDNVISTEANFQLNGHTLSLIPLPRNFKTNASVEGFLPAFFCRVISDYDVHQGGNNFDIHTCLDRVLPLVGFNYRLPINFLQTISPLSIEKFTILNGNMPVLMPTK